MQIWVRLKIPFKRKAEQPPCLAAPQSLPQLLPAVPGSGYRSRAEVSPSLPEVRNSLGWPHPNPLCWEWAAPAPAADGCSSSGSCAWRISSLPALRASPRTMGCLGSEGTPKPAQSLCRAPSSLSQDPVKPQDALAPVSPQEGAGAPQQPVPSPLGTPGRTGTFSAPSSPQQSLRHTNPTLISSCTTRDIGFCGQVPARGLGMRIPLVPLKRTQVMIPKAERSWRRHPQNPTWLWGFPKEKTGNGRGFSVFYSPLVALHHLIPPG